MGQGLVTEWQQPIVTRFDQDENTPLRSAQESLELNSPPPTPDPQVKGDLTVSEITVQIDCYQQSKFSCSKLSINWTASSELEQISHIEIAAFSALSCTLLRQVANPGSLWLKVQNNSRKWQLLSNLNRGSKIASIQFICCKNNLFLREGNFWLLRCKNNWEFPICKRGACSFCWRVLVVVATLIGREIT